jgi:serine/threonine protein kinase
MNEKAKVDHEKQALLAKYGVTTRDILHQGMEAEVYHYGTDAVLKLYSSSTSLNNLQCLQVFYTQLERTFLSYALPTIDVVSKHDAYIVTIEPRLPGTALSKLLPTVVTNNSAMERIFNYYVAAVLELSHINMPPTTTNYKLFDYDNLSRPVDGDWHQFLSRWLGNTIDTLSYVFTRDVDCFHEKLLKMQTVLAQPYAGPYKLIHGDIFPANMLVDLTGHVSALVDFGMFTMYGDPLFDAATAWVFFDMYDELHANVRERLLPVFVTHLGKSTLGKLYRYVLLYSMLSANSYASDCSDGHYRWCVDNLNTLEYWASLA